MAAGLVDYSMWPESDTERAGGRAPDQRRAGTRPPVQAEGEDTHARSWVEGSPAQPDAGTLERVSPSGGQTGPGVAPDGRSTGASGSLRAPSSGLKKRKC